MSVNFDVNFQSLFERLVDYTVIDDVNAVTFYNTFSRKDNYRDNFNLILSFDDKCFQIIILFLISAQYLSS